MFRLTSIGPGNPDFSGILGDLEGGSGLGKVSRSLVNFGAAVVPRDFCSGGHGISGFPLEPNLEGLAFDEIDEGSEFSVIYRDDEIWASVAVNIGLGEATAVGWNEEPAAACRNGIELAGAIAEEENAQAATERWSFELGRSEILRGVEVEVPVAIDVAETEPEDGSRLSFVGESLEGELSGAVVDEKS